MNSYTIRDVIVYSTEFARIDHITEQSNIGNRLINHKEIALGQYLLVFRPFSISKDLEQPICKRQIRDKHDYLTKLFQEAIRPSSTHMAESALKCYLKRLRDSSDVDSNSYSMTD